MLRSRLSLPLLVLGFATVCSAQQTPPPVTQPPASTDALTKEVKDEVLSKLEEIVTKRAFVPGVDLSKWPEFVAKQRESIDKAEKETEFSRAINNALRDFGVSHIRFLVPRAAQARVRTSATGIGIGGRPVDGGLTVTMVFPKSPAEEAGIKQGDVVTSVDGKVPDSAAVFLGDEGSEVKLKVKGSDNVERELTLVRKPYSTTREDTLTWSGEDTAVLRVHSFSNGYKRDVIEKLMTEAARAKFLVVDLRSNGGGATTNLNHLLSLLLPPDTVIGTFVSRRTVDQFKEKNGKEESDPVVLAGSAQNKFKTSKRKVDPFGGKIAVLLNRGSASASEICAMALKENANAVIVGSNSAGAVLASVFGKLPHGYEIQYPIMDYVSGKGVRLEKHPITPDIEENARPEDGKIDAAVTKAVEKLKSAS